MREGSWKTPPPDRQSRIGAPLPKRCARGPSPACSRARARPGLARSTERALA
ncbi:hypothetical protein DB32_001746 [Sandaracinus amylolyticus]|uniref:Uncharacterized protein n=1 Tax=Sandaracinus amylolyticus TaxID=927083 RepID=A0A0F6YI18_9BACT|nr:hypothetical protein DB32_001746 [Sandaracinus amylolyticus]